MAGSQNLYRLRGRLGGLALAAKYDPRQYTAAARRAFDDRFLAEVDPDGSLRRVNPVEAQRRADAARKLYFARLAYKSAKAQARRRRQS